MTVLKTNNKPLPHLFLPLTHTYIQAMTGSCDAPIATYAALIAVAIEMSPDKQLLLEQIYDFISKHRCLIPIQCPPNWKVRTIK